VILVERQFVPDPETVQYGYRHTYSQAEDIDEGKGFIFKEISAGDL
jgi:hypothetical protein